MTFKAFFYRTLHSLFLSRKLRSLYCYPQAFQKNGPLNHASCLILGHSLIQVPRAKASLPSISFFKPGANAISLLHAWCAWWERERERVALLNDPLANAGMKSQVSPDVVCSDHIDDFIYIKEGDCPRSGPWTLCRDDQLVRLIHAPLYVLY